MLRKNGKIKQVFDVSGLQAMRLIQLRTNDERNRSRVGDGHAFRRGRQKAIESKVDYSQRRLCLVLM